MVSDRAFIFHKYIPLGKILFLVPKSRSSVKVSAKYQGHSFREKKKKPAVAGAFVFHKHILAFFYAFSFQWSTRNTFTYAKFDWMPQFE